MATIQAVAEAMGGQVDEVRDVSLLRMGQTPTLDLDPVDLVALADGEAAPWRHQDPRHVIVDDADRGGAVATGVPRVAGPG